MKQKKLEDILEGFHKLYPKKAELYYTKDGNVFLEKSPAIDHANKTKQKWFVANNPKMMPEIKAKKEEDKKTEAEKALAINEAKLKGLDLEQIGYHDALSLATDLGLTLEKRDTENVMAALATKKELLNK